MSHDLVWVPSPTEPGVAYALRGDRVYRMQIKYSYALAARVLASGSIRQDHSLWTPVNADDLKAQTENDDPPITERSS
jgi:hypothetical protein